RLFEHRVTHAGWQRLEREHEIVGERIALHVEARVVIGAASVQAPRLVQSLDTRRDHDDLLFFRAGRRDGRGKRAAYSAYPCSSSAKIRRDSSSVLRSGCVSASPLSR